MESNLGYLLAANVALWLGIAGYLAFLASRQGRLERRIQQMETIQND